MKRSSTCLLLTVFAWTVASGAETSSWRMVPTDSHLEYVASYQGQPAPGEFHQFSVELRFDPRNPAGGRLHVTVNLASADMHSTDVNEAIMRKPWLDAAQVGPAEFTSTDIERLSDNRFRANGTLQIKGVRRDLKLPFEWESRGSKGILKGAVTLDRTGFNIGTGQWASPSPIGLNVNVKFRVTFRRAD